MSASHIIGLAVTLLIIVGLSIYSGRQIKSAKDFASGGKSGAIVVGGAIMGTLVGGSSTVGTAQLAYNYGMSAWWFTLGAGIACLVLVLFYTVPLRRTGCPTLMSIITREYGAPAGMLSSVLSCIGTFINIISQLIAATAVIAVIAPKLGLIPQLIIAAALMAVYVIFGGVKGAGIVGVVKLILLYVAMIGAGIIVLSLCGGVGSFKQMVISIPNGGVNFFSLFARGAGKDLGSALSLILGVVTTQSYAQGLLSGKSDGAARAGAIISTCMIPPIGIGGILVGLYMRANYPGIAAKTALTTFVLEHMPDLLGGVVLAALLIAVVGTGAGLALGISTIINNDIVKRLRKGRELESPLFFSRICIVVILALACCLSTGSLGDTILNFAFMSMGLRGAVLFAPLCAALWLPGRIRPGFACTAIIAGPVMVLVFGLLDVLPFDPLFIGVGLALVIMAVGLAVGGRKDSERLS